MLAKGVVLRAGRDGAAKRGGALDDLRGPFRIMPGDVIVGKA